MGEVKRELLDEFRRLFDVVDDDMRVYEITGVMDVASQNTALSAMDAILAQIREEGGD